MKKLLAILSILIIGCTSTPVEQDTLDTEFLSDSVYCEDEACFDCSKTLYSGGEVVDLGFDMPCDTSLWNSFDPLRTNYAYWEGTDLKLYNYGMQTSNEMMSVLEDTEGASIFWAPSAYRFAVVTMNWNYEGDKTKVFVLDIDSQGRLVDKQSYLLKVRHSCHDAGCNVLDGYFWFDDEDTIKYQTWEDDPYDDSKATLETYEL